MACTLGNSVTLLRREAISLVTNSQMLVPLNIPFNLNFVSTKENYD